MIRITALVQKKMVDHALDGYPIEVCGLLVGRDTSGTRIIDDVFATENGFEQCEQLGFRINPIEFVRVSAAALSKGLDVVGVYHSHPDHRAIPSNSDRQLAIEVWGDQSSWSYIIVEVSQKTVRLRSWILDRREFKEEEFQVMLFDSVAQKRLINDFPQSNEYKHDL